MLQAPAFPWLFEGRADETLAMKEYGDYSMYEFIHFQINIPAVLNAE